MVKYKYVFIIACVSVFFLDSCGSSSTSTDAGDIENGYTEIDGETFEIGEHSQNNFKHSRTGFFRSGSHVWGFEENDTGTDRGESHISFNVSGSSGSEGYSEWYIRWNGDEIDEDFVFFICNPGDEKIENTNKNLVPLGYDDDCSVSTEELPNNQKVCGTLSVKKYYKAGYEKIGICQQYTSGAPILKAVLNIHPYDLNTNDIIYIPINKPLDRDKVSNLAKDANNVFQQAVSNVKFQESKPPYSRKERNPNYSFSDIPTRESYLFVGAGNENSTCYDIIPDDIDIFKSYANDTYFYNNSVGNPGRIVAMISQFAAIYWTFNVDRSICENNLFKAPKKNGKEYYVGTLNSAEDEWNCRFEDNVFQKKMRFENGRWELYNKGEWTTDLSIIKPRCHVLYSTDEGENAVLMQRHVPKTSRAVTKTLPRGRIAFYYSGEKNSVVIHEMGHLLDLSDVDEKNNLMNYKGGGVVLRYTKLLARKSDEDPFNTLECQWECFHNKDQCADAF